MLKSIQIYPYNRSENSQPDTKMHIWAMAIRQGHQNNSKEKGKSFYNLVLGHLRINMKNTMDIDKGLELWLGE